MHLNFSARAHDMLSFCYHGDGLRHLINQASAPLHAVNDSVEWMTSRKVIAAYMSFALVPEDR